MSYVRNFILFATFVLIGISASNASADADDFNLDYDDPTNGESNVDPENIIEMKVQIENVVNQPMSFEMKILNASGKIVFKTSDKNTPWNGKLNNNGEVLPEGNYLWQLTTFDIDKKPHQHHGKITLVK